MVFSEHFPGLYILTVTITILYEKNGEEKMEKKIMKSIILISIILVSTIGGLSVFVKPGVANLDESISDISEQELENKTTEPQGTVTVKGFARKLCNLDLLCIYL